MVSEERPWNLYWFRVFLLCFGHGDVNSNNNKKEKIPNLGCRAMLEWNQDGVIRHRSLKEGQSGLGIGWVQESEGS